MNRIASSTAFLLAMLGMAAAVWFWVATPPPAENPLAPPEPATLWQLEALADLSPLAKPGSSGFEHLPTERVYRLDPAAVVQLERDETGGALKLPLPGGRVLEGAVRATFSHSNGDSSIHVRGEANTLERATITTGRSGLFARITTADGLYLVHSDATGSWLIDLNDERLEVDNFHNDTLGNAPVPHPAAAAAQGRSAAPEASVAGLAVPQQNPNLHQIDVMFIYTPDMLQRYPGDLIDTRLNHLVTIANQAMVDSLVPIVVRLVHHRPVNYTRNRNNSATVRDLTRAMAGEHVPGLAGVRADRQQYGADIVALTWPHDIETRGSCGVAFFPQIDDQGNADPAFGVHIDNDGASNWSICSDAVFTHELGHNLGAEHQRGAASTDDPAAFNYGFVRPGRFHTVMGSFGTGDPNRYFRLDVFSNPDIQCGGQPCGSLQHGERADNARKLTELAPVVASYANPVIPGMAERPAPSEPDSDGDGVSDWEDPYPFDPHDGQDPPETEPPLVFSPREVTTPQSSDQWELLVVSSGNDRVLSYGLDGRLRAVVSEPEPVDAGLVLTEFSDIDIDGEGRIYLLASGDVRRFDRMSGRLIDVFLTSELPQPRDLQSSFPRALGWLSNGQLVVLGDDAIERYHADGRQVNWRADAHSPTEDPESWNQVLDLPLRAFVERSGHLYVAEARHNRIMTFRMPIGQRLDDVAGSNNGQIVDPRDMTFGPDGRLYVANGRANNVLRYDVDSNRLVDTFVSAGSGGLDFARALAFGPDGDLYVASRNNNAILRFDGDNGDFIETVTQGNLLEQPESLRFAPALDQVHAGHSGHYFVPERSGEGWLLEVLDTERATLSWFTYPPIDAASGEQAWAVGVGRIEGARIVFDEVVATRMIDPDAGFSEGNLEMLPWGNIEFMFDHCNHGRMTFESDLFSASGNHDFIRLAPISGIPCGNIGLAPATAAPGISGQWYDPDTDGQGWFLQEVEPGRVVAVWYSYGNEGEQVWMIGEGHIDGPELVFEEMSITRGTFFGQDFVDADVQLLPWGRLEFHFEDCSRAEVYFESSLAGFSSGAMQAHRLTELSDLTCDLAAQ